MEFLYTAYVHVMSTWDCSVVVHFIGRAKVLVNLYE